MHLQMDGRQPPPSIDEVDQDERRLAVLPPPPGSHMHETYIVQMPKDQVYRVPPPENALIVEQYRNPTVAKKERSRCCSRFLIVCLVLLALVAIIGITLVTLYFIFRPKEPEFSVTNFVVKNPPSSAGQKKSRPQYHVSLTVKNPSTRWGLEYDKDAEVSLHFENAKVATGKFPSLDQDTEASTNVNVDLVASNERMPRQMEKSMNDKSDIPITLDMDMKVGGRMTRDGVKTGTLKYDVGCKFRVSTIRNGTRVLSQECQTHKS